MFRPSTALLGLLVACGGQVDTASCEALCNELVTTCAIGAYPDTSSCIEGCLYDQDQGAEIDQELACVQQASCSLFVIVECEHTYGLE